MRAFLILALLVASPVAVSAQDRTQTLADIRQELTVLYVEIQKLKRELSTTGGVNANLSATNTLDRVNQMEAELQRMTAATEQLTNRIDGIVADGTNKIGDLEFRLCELESGCDIAKLGDTPTLGGGALPAVTQPVQTPVAPADGGGAIGGIASGSIDTSGMELAVAEREDFERARTSFEDGEYENAVEQLQRFTDTYQGGPLTGLAHLMRGEALQQMGLTSSAARAYLESYSGTPNGATSPTALLKLGLALNGLGQSSESCITLGEVTLRFPASDASIEAQAARASMGCS